MLLKNYISLVLIFIGVNVIQITDYKASNPRKSYTKIHSNYVIVGKYITSNFFTICIYCAYMYIAVCHYERILEIRSIICF